MSTDEIGRIRDQEDIWNALGLGWHQDSIRTLLARIDELEAQYQCAHCSHEIIETRARVERLRAVALAVVEPNGDGTADCALGGFEDSGHYSRCGMAALQPGDLEGSE